MTETEKKDKDRSKPQPKPCLPPKLCRQHSATARIYACKTERFLAFCENFAVSLREQRRPFSQHDDSRPKKPLTVNTAQRHKLLKTCWFCAIAFVVFRLNSTRTRFGKPFADLSILAITHLLLHKGEQKHPWKKLILFHICFNSCIELSWH